MEIADDGQDLSATYSDLKDFRDAVYDVLRMLRHDVIAMEDYVATDAYPLHKCLADVAACDVYIGLVGWRYGYIPDRDNPEQKSITELEYRQAGKANLPRLMFLADKEAPWPAEYNDAKTGEGDKEQRIAAFRRELETAKLVSYFRTPEQLAKLVSVAVQLCVAEGLRKAVVCGTARPCQDRALPPAWRGLGGSVHLFRYSHGPPPAFYAGTGMSWHFGLAGRTRQSGQVGGGNHRDWPGRFDGTAEPETMKPS